MNKVVLIGNLTRDPEVRTTGSGINVCTFSIAVNRRFANQSGEKVTDFFDIVAWRQLGDLCGKYLAKGRKVCITGQLQTRSYEAKDGSKRNVTEIVADDVEFLTPKQDGASSGGYSGGKERPAGASPAPAFDAAEGFTDVEDDELPF